MPCQQAAPLNSSEECRNLRLFIVYLLLIHMSGAKPYPLTACLQGKPKATPVRIFHE
jgi:hypothetical protein